MTKSKPALITAVVLGIAAAGYYWQSQSSPFQRALAKEWIENSFPEKVDTEDSNWNVLPYGYTLAPWPKTFQSEPIVTKLTYHKGPPKKFLQEIIQVWRPVEVELTIDGPRTLVPKFGVNDWRTCFSSRFSCHGPKKAYEEYIELKSGAAPVITWFESLDVLGAKGVHVAQDFPSYQLHRFSVITDKGVFQTFTLKAIKTPIGDAALDVFLKTLGGMKVRDELAGSREWIQNRIQSIKLNVVRATPDPKLRIEKLIEVQNFVASHLSVDPTQFAPYFHMAGVTHLLGVELYRSARSYFHNQESWTHNVKPTLEALIRYARDFEAEKGAGQAAVQVNNLEALLQDILLLQQKLSKGQNLNR